MTTKLIQSTSSAYSYPLLIKRLLHSPLSYSPHQEIIYRDLKRYDYATFVGRLGRLANALKALGVESGNTVAVMDWDSHRYLECFFAIPMMGAVLHTVNVRLSPEQIVYTINHAEDDVILVHADFLPLVEGVRDQLTTVKTFILLKEGSGNVSSSVEFAGEYEELVDRNESGYEFPDFDENTLATTFYTTGTTGLPKGVFFSHRQLLLHTFACLAAVSGFRAQGRFDSGDVYMPLTPMFHAHAWGFPYLATMLGAKQVYPGRYEPEVILELVEKEKVTFSHCVPTILHMLLNNPQAKRFDLSHWKMIIGGSALPKALCQAAMQRGIDVYTGYGMSETCPVLTMANLKPEMLELDLNGQSEIRCRTGLPLPLVDLRIVDALGNDVPPGTNATGEVVVRAPWLTQGYAKDPERAEQLWENEWLHTGDIGFVDNEGYLQVTDRIKDVIKTGGEWISSLELEDILTQHEAVSEAAVIAISDPKWGERPLALAVLKEEYKGRIGEEDLRAFYAGFADKGIISKWGIPSRILVVDSIAKTSVGKMNKKLLREQFKAV